MIWPFNTMQDILPNSGTLAICALVRACALISVFLLAGCAGPDWYAQAISGHLALMTQRANISEVLAEGKLNPALQQDLKLALEIRDFAINQLGLPDNGSYTEFVRTGRQAVTWNIVATPEFSLEARRWCFIVAGCVSYRGYFDQRKAERFAHKLEKKSYDVTISPAIAYSTLGWFDDPLLDTMLQYPDEQLAALIFHELAHQQLYVKGDTAFSEAYASFVEEAGVRIWLQSTGRDDLLLRWQSMKQASIQFDILLRDTRDQLNGIYNSGLDKEEMRSQKKLVFIAMKTRYLALVNERWGGVNHYRSWFSPELNNARLALMKLYRGGNCAFEKLYESAGGNMVLFNQLATDRAALSPHERAAWLNQSCDRRRSVTT
jgi:predicted aminopeptidase